MQMIARVEITKGFESWVNMYHELKPMMDEAGISIVWAG